MKKIIFKCALLVWLIVIQLGLTAQNTWNWVGYDNNFASKILGVTSIGNYIYANALSVYYGDSIPYVTGEILKFDLLGKLISTKRTGNMDSTYVFGFSQYTNGVFCSGIEQRYSLQPTKPYNYKAHFYDINSNKSFDYLCPPTNGQTRVNYATKLNSNAYFIAFSSGEACKIVLIDSLKNTKRERIFCTINKNTYVTGMNKFNNFYYIIISEVSKLYPNYPQDLVIHKLDTLFNIVSSYSTTAGNFYGPHVSAMFPNGDFVVGGRISDGWTISGSQADIFNRKYIRKYDKNLNVLWTKYIGLRSAAEYGVKKLIITNDTHIVGIGFNGHKRANWMGDTTERLTNCIFKFKANGDSVWFREYETLPDDLWGTVFPDAKDISEMPDGGFVACGTLDVWNPLMQRGWLFRVDANGCFNQNCTVGMMDIENKTAFKIYPNPVYSVLNVSNSESILAYKIFSANGSLVKKGNSFPIATDDLTESLYFIQLKTKNNQLFNQKFIK